MRRRPDLLLRFRLAHNAGCTVAEFNRRCSSREFTYWKAYYKLEPRGEQRFDLGIAQLAALVANMLQRGKRRKRFKVSDFVPNWDPVKRRNTPKMVLAKFALLAKAGYGKLTIHKGGQFDGNNRES